MRHYYQSFLPALLLVALLGTGVRAQTTITSQGFEGAGAWTFTESPATYNVSGDVWAVVGSTGPIMPSEMSQFWGMQDLENPNSGLDPQDTEHTLTFADITVTGFSDMQLKFDWNAVDFNVSSEILEYEVTLDGTGQGRVNLITGQSGDISSNDWETETITIPDGTNTVSITMYAIFNGGSQYAGFDNFLLSRDNPADPCGITNLGPANVTCLTESTDSNVDEFVIELAYLGVDDDASLLIEAGPTSPSNDVTATTTIGGDDFTTQANGIITLTSTASEFVEGDEVRVTLNDGGGNCSLVVNISTNDNQCSNPCDINLDPNEVRFFCNEFTAGNDGIFAYFPFTGGPEPGFAVSATGGATVGGNDPAVDDDGVIILDNIMEGGLYQITVGGGGCPTQMFPLSVPTDLCVEPNIVINEVMADPSIPGESSNLANDVNNDGSANSADEFVEIFNRSENDIDISGYTLEENNGVFYTFPATTILPARTAFVVIADPNGATLSCETSSVVINTGFIGLNNSGDVVALRTGGGDLVHSMSYGPEGGLGESLALVPDGDITNGYTPHTMISNLPDDPLNSSPCQENDDPQFTLPIELLNFAASSAEKSVTLTWSTENEIDNDRFIVERSTNGRQWRQLGRVMASGRTSGDYSFRDEQPLNGENIYRLRQVDLDGSFAIYGPVIVEFTTNQLAAFPNPADNALWLNQTLTGQDQLEVIDGNGRRVQVQSSSDGQINVSNLRPGLYLLRVERGDEVQVVRFVKQ